MHDDKLNIEQSISDREEFFLVHGLDCTCRQGYAICENCHLYYADTNWKNEIIKEYFS